MKISKALEMELKFLINVARIIERMSDISGFIAAILTVATFILVLIEVAARAIFNVSTLIADEYTTYFFVGLTYLGLSYILRRDGHIRVKILFSKLSKKKQTVLDLLCCIIAVFLLIFFSIYSFLFFIESYKSKMTAPTPIETPLFLPQSVIFIGLILLLLQFVSRIIHDIDEIVSASENHQIQKKFGIPDQC